MSPHTTTTTTTAVVVASALPFSPQPSVLVMAPSPDVYRRYKVKCLSIAAYFESASFLIMPVTFAVLIRSKISNVQVDLAVIVAGVI